MKHRVSNNRASCPLTESGGFVVGCNYWASHAGTAMWSDWRPRVVDRDLKKIAAAGLQVLRVFPLWPDFQPLVALEGCGGVSREVRHGENPLPDDDAGSAGMSAEALRRFTWFADRADHYGLKLIVALITGWMSGRLFVPQALAGHNVLTDPMALMWQVRFVRHFVRRFAGHPAILAWGLGNECNCMGTASREAAWNWTAAISQAIRVADPSRPVVSDMHSLSVDPGQSWTITDQAELTDVLTTHPYVVFTPHSSLDPLNTMRSCLHAAAESRLYADVGGKPCLAEEMGTLGPIIASESIAADYIRANLFSLWAHDAHGLFWWCAFDQKHLAHAPYDWSHLEQELGLWRPGGVARPVVRTLGRFRTFLERLPFRHLPPRQTDAVCILTDGQDHWGIAYSAFILAKQAGFDIEFQYGAQPLKPARFYLMPSIAGHGPMPRHHWLELLDRVRAGATLYLSYQDAFLTHFEAITGLEIQTRRQETAPAEVVLDGVESDLRLPSANPIRLALHATRARLLGRDTDGNPAFSNADYGKGRVYFLSFPLESEWIRKPGVFVHPEAPPAWKLYRHMAEEVGLRRVVTKACPQAGVTEHPFDARHRLVILVNYAPKPAMIPLRIQPPWKVGKLWYGRRLKKEDVSWISRLDANDAAVFDVRR